MIIIAIIVVIIIILITVVRSMAEQRLISGSAIALRESQLLKRPTYLIFGRLGGFSREWLAREIESHGFKEAPMPVTARNIRPVTLIWTSQDESSHFVPISYRIPCLIKNVLDIDTYSDIANKIRLHKVMREQDPKLFSRHFAQSALLSEFKYPARKGSVFILRPAGLAYFSGKDILRVTSVEELAEARMFYQKKKPLLSPTNVLVSEYLDEPYLFDGRKFHLRMYLLICLTSKGLKWSLWGMEANDFSLPRGKILTAAKSYIRGEYSDAGIHDTHAKSTPEAFFFPTHAARICAPNGSPCALDIRDIYAQMCAICAALAARLTEQGVRPYEESARAFDIFGLDLMIVRKMDNSTNSVVDPCVVLLEVNDRVGYDTPDSPLTAKFQQDYFTWAWNQGVAPLLEK